MTKQRMRFKCVGRPSSGADDSVDGCGHEWRETPLGPAPPHQVAAGVGGYETRNVACPKCGNSYVWWMNAALWNGPQRIAEHHPNKQPRQRPRPSKKAKRHRRW